MSKEMLGDVQQFNRQTFSQNGSGVANASSGGCDASCSSSCGNCGSSDSTTEQAQPVEALKSK